MKHCELYSFNKTWWKNTSNLGLSTSICPQRSMWANTSVSGQKNLLWVEPTWKESGKALRCK